MNFQAYNLNLKLKLQKITKIYLTKNEQKWFKFDCKKFGIEMLLKQRRDPPMLIMSFLNEAVVLVEFFKSIFEDFFSFFKKSIRIILTVFRYWTAELTVSKTVYSEK